MSVITTTQGQIPTTTQEYSTTSQGQISKRTFSYNSKPIVKFLLAK